MNLPNFKVKTLKAAREEMAKFGITENVSTLSQAKTLIFAKRAELSKAKAADKAKRIENEATSTVNTISKPTRIAPVATAKATPVSKPVAVDVQNYLALRVKQISGVWMSKAELAILSTSDETTSVLEQVITTLSKTDYHEGVLLSNAHIALQKSAATKHIDSRDILDEIKSSKAIALKSELEKRAFANLRTCSN